MKSFFSRTPKDAIPFPKKMLNRIFYCKDKRVLWNQSMRTKLRIKKTIIACSFCSINLFQLKFKISFSAGNFAVQEKLLYKCWAVSWFMSHFIGLAGLRKWRVLIGQRWNWSTLDLQLSVLASGNKMAYCLVYRRSNNTAFTSF